MFARLSGISRIIVLQIGIIFMAMLSAGMMLRVTGHGRRDAEIRLVQNPNYRPPGMAAFARDRGMLLLIIPTAFAVAAVRRKQKYGAHDESMTFNFVAIVVAGVLLFLAIGATFQPLISFGAL